MFDLHPTPPRWRPALELLWQLLKEFGMPNDLARGGQISRSFRLHVSSWLKPLENFVRMILMVEALDLPETKFALPKGMTRAAGTNAGRGGFANHESERWSVHFHMHEARATPYVSKPYAGYQGYRAPSMVSPWMLAERIEALIRVIGNPKPYVARLAARLYRFRAQMRAKGSGVSRDYFLDRDGKLARFHCRMKAPSDLDSG